VTNTEPSSPLGLGQRFAVECKQHVTPLVIELLGLRGPAAVSWLIVSIVVDAINCMSRRRTMPHVRKEQIERCSPSGADLYSPAAIVVPASPFGVFAASNHRFPDPVFCCAAHAVPEPPGPGRFDMKAPARPRAPRPHPAGSHERRITAVAQTEPTQTFLGFLTTNHTKSTKALPG